ncbi:MAG: radical SAM protein, partial [Candidatus Nanoarchaeia archaeon]|nr:radical SAM protein [Candidatus Nanoarchaeia archaeon]
IITNGMLMNQEICRKIIDSGLDHITISLDAATAKVYENIRKGANFDRVTKNVSTLVKEDINHSLDIRIGMTCSTYNIYEVPKMIGLCKKLGVKNLNVGGTHNWGRNYWKKEMKGTDLEENLSAAQKIIREAEHKSKQAGINLTFTFISSKKKMKCTWPWLGTYITVDGYITPCCIHGFDPRILNFGNIFKRNFKKIWNSKEYRKFRAAFKNGRHPKFCNGCPEI